MSLLPPLQWPDVEAAVCAYLTAELGDVQAITEIPDPRPATFVLVARAGGVRTDSIHEIARLACEFWASDKASAADLGASCRDLLGRMPAASPIPGGYDVLRVQEFLGLTWAPDEDAGVTPTPRYILTIEARFRAIPKGA